MDHCGNNNELKIVLIGDSSVGKTSIIHTYIKGHFSKNIRYTIGVDCHTKKIDVDGKIYTLKLYDTAGQEKLAPMCRSYFRGADACVVVYDVSNARSFESIRRWIDDFLIYSAVHKDVRNFPILVLANKVDLENRAVSAQRALTWCSRTNVDRPTGDFVHVETSAKERLGLEHGFHMLTRKAVARRECCNKHIADEQTVQLTDEKPKAKTKKECSC